MKKIKTSTFDFPEIIANNFLYVDKTAIIWKLVEGGKDEYFLSRPRRFGKSLLVSTLKAIFQGRRELFKGLAIDKMAYDWTSYPVIHLDFANCSADTAESLETYLNHLLDVVAKENRIGVEKGEPSIRFENLINDLAAKAEADAQAAAVAKGEVKPGQVVVLVDEYDKPILGNITNTEHRDAILRVLKGFYSCIKKCEGRIRFAFITGVSKFCHVSLFSDLNNLTDITLNADYARLLGFTEAEIRSNFADRIPLAAEANGCSSEELMQKLLKWYDGYRFSEEETHVCNPVSISKFFNEGYRFRNFWIDTGMPTFLLELAKRTRFNFEESLSRPVSELAFKAYELDRVDPLSMLWQTGYLTIKENFVVDGIGTMYRLGFPDHEVELSFNMQLLAYYSGAQDSAMSSIVYSLTMHLREGRLEDFMKTLQAYFASIPYDIRGGDEHYYQTIFFITFLLLGTTIEAESRTNEGRIDAYVRTPTTVYIFEFKLNKTARKAIEQIVDRRYVEKFMNGGLPIVCIGANFNSKKGQLDNWKQLAGGC